MDRWIRVLGSLLVLALVLTSILPAAIGDDMIPEEETILAFRGENGAVMLYDSAAALVTELLSDAGADEVLFQQDGYVYFIAGSTLCRVKAEAGAAAEAIEASVDGTFIRMEEENAVYYVGGEGGRLLRKYDPTTGAASDVARLPEGGVELVRGLEGLYLYLMPVDGARSLYRFSADELKLYAVTLPVDGEYRAWDGYETLRTEEALYLRGAADASFTIIEENPVFAQTGFGDHHYYATFEEGVLKVYAWSLERGEKSALCIVTKPEEPAFVDSMAMVAGRLVMARQDGSLVILNLAAGSCDDRAVLSGDVIPETVSMAAVGDRVVVYGNSVLGDAQYAEMVQFDAFREDVVDEPNPFSDLIVETTTAPIATAAPTVAPVPTQTPTIQTTASASSGYTELKKWARGDSVRRLQERLNALGYDCGSADGVLGDKTLLMIRYFLCDAGLPDGNTATAEMQRVLFSSSAPTYKQYVLLKNGMSGIRVELMQQRLRELGYMAGAADGEFGPRTEEAVRLFQKAADLKVDGLAGQNTLKKLFASSAPKYTGYIDLRQGDSGAHVRRLEEKLVALGYLTKADSIYDKNTAAAVKAFQKDAGLKQTGTADIETQRALFSWNPAATATPAPAVTEAPTEEPTAAPTEEPTAAPTEEPTAAPTEEPTAVPTEEPTAAPTEEPTAVPTEEPTQEPTEAPAEPPVPTKAECVEALVVLLNAEYGDGAYTSETAVAWFEDALVKLGKLDEADADGLYGETEIALIRALQEQKGFAPDGGKYGLLNRQTFDFILEELDKLS